MTKRYYLLLLSLLCFIHQPKAETGLPSDSLPRFLTENKVLHFLTGHKYLTAPFVFYMPETNWVLGIGVKRFFHAGGVEDTLTRASNSSVFVQYSLNQQLMLEHNYQIFTNKERYYIMGYYGFSRFPVNYYGTGENASLANKEAINYDLLRFENLTMRKVKPFTFVGLGWRYFKMYNIRGEEGGIMEQEKITGYDGSTVSGLSAAILYDSRDNVLTTSKGSFLELSYTNHLKEFGSTHNFQRWIIDLRKFYKPFKTREDVVALQTYAQFSNGNIPFSELGLLGGDMIMRGYYQGSFRDNNLFAMQAEYRWQVLKRWGIAGFGGVGSVKKQLADFDIQTLKPSYGAGLRFKINRKENVNVRVDYGFGNGQQNLYFFIAEAF
ncbi:MAG: BamA/TamA family outer membrane protein [Spirosomataceae bacterium]|nr:BamA/TamA family outer membrane protein [Flectobacillus sp.]